MKAGAFKTTALHYQLQKLHTNTHLYTASHLVPDFQGRTFELRATYTFGKAQLKALRSITTQANLAVRNFPASVDSLRKRLKLRDGGPYYIFATTLADATPPPGRGERVLSSQPHHTFLPSFSSYHCALMGATRLASGK